MLTDLSSLKWMITPNFDFLWAIIFDAVLTWLIKEGNTKRKICQNLIPMFSEHGHGFIILMQWSL